MQSIYHMVYEKINKRFISIWLNIQVSPYNIIRNVSIIFLFFIFFISLSSSAQKWLYLTLRLYAANKINYQLLDISCFEGKKPKSKRKSFLAQLPDLRKLYETHENNDRVGVRDTTVTLLLLSSFLFPSHWLYLSRSSLTFYLAFYIMYLYLK